jgi:hypothetical protein
LREPHDLRDGCVAGTAQLWGIIDEGARAPDVVDLQLYSPRQSDFHSKLFNRQKKSFDGQKKMRK